jgi:hypothetical protein
MIEGTRASHKIDRRRTMYLLQILLKWSESMARNASSPPSPSPYGWMAQLTQELQARISNNLSEPLRAERFRAKGFLFLKHCQIRLKLPPPILTEACHRTQQALLSCPCPPRFEGEGDSEMPDTVSLIERMAKG